MMMNTKGNLYSFNEIILVFLLVLFLLVLFIGIIILPSFYIIGAGERGVLTSFGKPSQDVKSPGLHFKVPIMQGITKFDVQTQKYEAKADASSQDLQTVSTQVTINYNVDPSQVVIIYTNLGTSYEDRIIQPAVQEVVKASTAQYTAEELITKRPEVKQKIDDGLRTRLSSYGIVVKDVLITNFDFSTIFNAAIENKVTAEQNALAAKNKLQQVEYEKQQAITQAQGTAEALRLQKEQVTPDLIRLRQLDVQQAFIAKWNGKMPLVLGSSNPFIDVSSMVSNEVNASG